jgi:hypothetical protein
MDLGESEKILIMGSKMKKKNWKLPPGRTIAYLVSANKKEEISSMNV